jgi:putative NIF3 family GTP cyclohydrolase 1 type 2
MDTSPLSRRSLMLTGAAIATGSSARSQDTNPQLTAGQAIERIKQNVGIPWLAQTVDRIVAGTPETLVKGIAVTMMATLDVVQRAAASGKNMVITHEPTFFSHQDRTDNLTQDATYQFKVDFLRRHDMVSFHFHDHWHGHRPDGIATGMVRELGWEKNVDPENPRLFTFPGTPLGAFAQAMQRRLGIRTLRVVGDPNLPVNRVIASWGNVSLMPGIPFLSRPDVDVLVLGETHEWELVEYAQDTIASGKKKALILLGHVVSEQAGMKYCAEWLKGFITEVPVEFVPAAEPFWRPS